MKKNESFNKCQAEAEKDPNLEDPDEGDLNQERVPKLNHHLQQKQEKRKEEKRET